MTTSTNPEYTTIRLPKSHWRQIVDNIEEMCGVGRENIEILGHIETINGTDPYIAGNQGNHYHRCYEQSCDGWEDWKGDDE
jgi:hypothetical protein